MELKEARLSIAPDTLVIITEAEYIDLDRQGFLVHDEDPEEEVKKGKKSAPPADAPSNDSGATPVSLNLDTTKEA